MPCLDCQKILEAAATVTACECPGPGDCSRHQCRKNAHLHALCRTRQDYFDLWEAGRGPCLGPLRPASPCRRRGAQISTIGCQSCGGTTTVAVFACALHEECTLAAAEPGIASCAGCADFSAAEVV
jgi:hypothetical protein